LPILSTTSLYATHNNTSIQLIAGAVIGTINGVRRILLYHFFMKFHLYNVGSYNFFKWFIPRSDKDKCITDGDNYENTDQDVLMARCSEKKESNVMVFDNNNNNNTLEKLLFKNKKNIIYF